MRVGKWFAGMGLLVGCGTALKVVDEPLNPERLARLRRGAAHLSCRAHPSSEFALFLVCPPKDLAIGFSSTNGMISLTCADLSPSNCRELSDRLLLLGCPAQSQVP
jgi:hypothetical protein